jgi:hypothetical protein
MTDAEKKRQQDKRKTAAKNSAAAKKTSNAKKVSDAKKAEKAKMEKSRDFTKSVVDLNAENFKNKDVQKWANKKATKRRKSSSVSVPGLRNLGSVTKIKRM